MTTVRKVASPIDEATRVIYEELEATLGFVPNLYKGLANSPQVLTALWDARKRLMEPGELDDVTKQWLAFAALTLVNNRFSLHAHTSRLKQRGISDAAICEAVGVLAYYAGTGAATNAFGMSHDFNAEMTEQQL